MHFPNQTCYINEKFSIPFTLRSICDTLQNLTWFKFISIFNFVFCVSIFLVHLPWWTLAFDIKFTDTINFHHFNKVICVSCYIFEYSYFFPSVRSWQGNGAYHTTQEIYSLCSSQLMAQSFLYLDMVIRHTDTADTCCTYIS